MAAPLYGVSPKMAARTPSNQGFGTPEHIRIIYRNTGGMHARAPHASGSV